MSVIKNVSFIVIAKNEESSLPKCLNSITNLNLENCEVVCVDSCSTDKTLQIMHDYAKCSSFFKIKVLVECKNAAEARNMGKKEASKKYYYFIDGDVELNLPFIEKALKEMQSSDICAVVGGLDEIVYDDSTGIPKTEKYARSYYAKKTKLISWGGIFIAKAESVSVVGDYDERFFRCQDLDYSIRFADLYEMVALPISMGIHHTGEYKNRPGLFLKKGFVLNVGMLARKHHKKSGFLKIWYDRNKTIMWGGGIEILVLLLFVLAVFSNLAKIALLLLCSVIFVAEIAYSIFKKQPLQSSLIIHFVWPVAVLWGYFKEPSISAEK